jgi:cytochrome c551/c552
MRYRFVVGTVAVAACTALLSGASAAGARLPGATAPGGATSGGTWGGAEEVPGTAALNQGGNAQVLSVSCGSAGNCSAGGYYHDGSGAGQAFVVSETNGTWGTAEQVPGTATLAPGGNAAVTSVSCARAGYCSAGGNYADSSGLRQVFVASEKDGVWHSALEVPGIAALNQRGNATISTVSCASAGNCSAGGNYLDGSGHTQAFVVSKVNGTWGTAEEVPGSAALNQGGTAEIISLSCGAAGNCGAGGLYEDSSGKQHAFVVSEANGVWGNAEEVPGTAEVDSVATSVSCPSAGNCNAAGYYEDVDNLSQAFVAAETSGAWGLAQEIPMPDLSQRGLASIAVSCGSAASCSAAGDFQDDSENQQAFAGTGKKGVWGAEEVPGSAALNQGGTAEISSVSCGSAGDCSAGGTYADGSGDQQALVFSETNGTWGTAEEVPGSAALNQGGNAVILSVSCASADNCSGGGFYKDSSGQLQAFVVNETGT